MKWTFLKRRSEVQKLEIQVSPVSGTCFDPSNHSQSTLRAVPSPIQEELGEQKPVDPGSTLQQNEWKRIDMVLSEIQTILKDRPLPLQKCGTRQGNAALPVSENDHSAQVESKLNEPGVDPIAQEIEALLRISTPKN